MAAGDLVLLIQIMMWGIAWYSSAIGMSELWAFALVFCILCFIVFLLAECTSYTGLGKLRDSRNATRLLMSVLIVTATICVNLSGVESRRAGSWLPSSMRVLVVSNRSLTILHSFRATTGPATAPGGRIPSRKALASTSTNSTPTTVCTASKTCNAAS